MGRGGTFEQRGQHPCLLTLLPGESGGRGRGRWPSAEGDGIVCILDPTLLFIPLREEKHLK